MKARSKINARFAIARWLGWLTRRPAVRILTFHGFEPGGNPLIHIDPKLFEEQMAWLAGEGYQTCTVRDLVLNWPARLSQPRTVVLTFDDGLLSHLAVACDVLSRHGMTGTFFVPTAYVGEQRQSAGDGLSEYSGLPMLSWPDLAEMVRAGFEIGAHSHRHVRIKQAPQREAAEEVARPKELIEQRLGVPVSSFSYPKGHRDAFAPWTRELLAAAGYRAGCTMMGGRVRPGDDLLTLPRTGLCGYDRVDRFAMKVRGDYDVLAMVLRR